MAHISITATGDYAYEVRHDTIAALTDSIRLHMAAYGLKGVEVRAEVTTEAAASSVPEKTFGEHYRDGTMDCFESPHISAEAGSK